MSTAKKTTKGEKAADEGVLLLAEGVLLSEVKSELVLAELSRAKLSTKGDLPDQVARLVRHYRATTPPADLADCNTCGGDSNADEAVCPVCPYCGVGGVAEAPATAKPEPVTPASASPEVGALPAPEKKAEAATGQAAGKAKVSKGKAEGAKPPVGSDGDHEKKAEVSKLTGQTLTQVKGKGKDGAAPVPAGPVYTVADLDAALVDVEKAKQGEVACYWDLGHAVHRIFSQKLYLQRRSSKKADAPLYETWGAFCEAELGMTGGNAYRVMDVAVNYDRDTAVRVGVKKLNALLRVEDPEKRAKLLEGAEKVTVADLEEKVQKLIEKEQAGKTADRGRLSPAQKERNAKGSSGSLKKTEDAKQTNVAKPAAEGAEKITAALVLGRVKVKLFKKGEKVADPEAKRAKRLADDPFGLEETVNGVTSKYTIGTDAAGCLVLFIDRKRA